MTSFLSELGKKAAERWLALVVLPGLLFLALACATWIMRRHGTWFDIGPVSAQAERWKAAKAGPLFLATAAFMIGASGVALLAQGTAAGVERLWFAAGVGPISRCLTRRRQRSWGAKDDAYWAAVFACHRDPSSPVDPDLALEVRQRICPVPPARPTWMADRARATSERVHLAYGLDLTSLWPRLWLVLPDTVRAELGASRTALSGDARLFSWGLLYLVPTLWWWPAVLITLVTCPVAWWRARSSTDRLAELAEAAVDLYAPAVAGQLGLPTALTPDVAEELTRILRKDG